MAVAEVALPGADVPGHGVAGPPHADVQCLHADAQVSRIIASQLARSEFMPTCRCFVEGCDDEDGEGNFTQPFLEFSVPRDHGGSKFLRQVPYVESFGGFQALDKTVL